MQAWSLIAVRMKSGNWKVKVMGNADCHYESWSGENGRIRTAPSQPHAGFQVIDDALLWSAKRFPTMESLIAWGERVGDGQWTDGREYDGSVSADCHWPRQAESAIDTKRFAEVGVRLETLNAIRSLAGWPMLAAAPDGEVG